MRLGRVIGRVTLSQAVPSLTGARWLIVSPLGREQYRQGLEGEATLSREPSLVAYDALGGGVGQVIGFVEGREAAVPFEQPTPIDAICTALVDQMFYHPAETPAQPKA
ncbi:MAG: EutN/CcmL family microcompartment protein [Verrucomicrobiae bacterium]|nr:EutN/CcmL family microcompartment protein [Verrucomicrobiae bacterium]